MAIRHPPSQDDDMERQEQHNEKVKHDFERIQHGADNIAFNARELMKDKEVLGKLALPELQRSPAGSSRKCDK